MKLNILFIINKNKANAKGLCALMCRLTYNKVRKTFATGQFINPDHWNSKQQIVRSEVLDGDYYNLQLSLIKTKINRAFLMLQVKQETFTVTDVYRALRERKQLKNTIL